MLAYAIAFKSGRWKNLMLVLVGGDGVVEAVEFLRCRRFADRSSTFGNSDCMRKASSKESIRAASDDFGPGLGA